MIKQKTLIIILNWNGSHDTIECCKSLNLSIGLLKNKADIFVLDNNSNYTDYVNLEDSFADVYGDCESLNCNDDFFKNLSLISLKAYRGQGVRLLRSSVNHGFARGCNIGAMFAKKMGYKNILFLNNDTIVENDFLEPLLDSLTHHDAVIPQIRYDYDRNIIWNCGGILNKFGKRKYFFAKKDVNHVSFPAESFEISFATGCCILFKTSFFSKIGCFSEKFFFGEEDIELSLRLLKLKAKMICNTKSIIFHKVGSSITGSPERLLRKAYIHYLNRLVNMKDHLGLIWYIWLLPSLSKIVINLIYINKIGINKSLSVAFKLFKDAIRLNSVDKFEFERILNEGF
ncbi:glycosyltransferase family 2 protein [Pantoea sp. PSNIH1]|uniref:glycosyltransferase family 2 protein n=1 Tax=Pantoea sp. PSNIH1 TaxID=1484158 RepID=UPI0011A2A68D|nr:glycosyltransferase family 2 protein [Pantoea sp. PSNIH1]